MKPRFGPRSTIVFGFDSAWTDHPKAPGAICSIAFDRTGGVSFQEPCLVSFAGALQFIDERRSGHELSLVALDQPTIVANARGSRPVEKVAASVISYVGGGVQPAYRERLGMFCDRAPIWKFLDGLGAEQDPIRARSSREGRFLIEVFPALALPGLEPSFARRLAGPKYNPANKSKFRLTDWRAVAAVVARTARELELEAISGWAEGVGSHQKPHKADQDRLDSVICALIGLCWLVGHRPMAMIGDLRTGYMVTPVSEGTMLRLDRAARRRRSCFDVRAPGNAATIDSPSEISVCEG